MAAPPLPIPPAPVQSRGLTLLLGCAGIAAGVLGWRWLTGWVPPDPAWSSMAARLGAASLALLPAGAVLWAMIVTQMAARFVTGRFDPTAGTDGPFLRVNQRAISNTVEQFAVLAPALLALAAGVAAAKMPMVIALALVFAAARLLFWAGYLAHKLLRAPGMAATFVAVTATLAAATWVWLP
jgi:uncharacterized membrane protein YecN with MAPEG domain